MSGRFAQNLSKSYQKSIINHEGTLMKPLKDFKKILLDFERSDLQHLK